jgi:hypothetical protein
MRAPGRAATDPSASKHRGQYRDYHCALEFNAPDRDIGVLARDRKERCKHGARLELKLCKVDIARTILACVVCGVA